MQILVFYIPCRLEGTIKKQNKARVFSFFVILIMLLSAAGLPILHARAATTISLDGTVPAAQGFSSTTSNTVTFTSAPIGTGTNRLMLVSIAWNAGSNARTISSVQFLYGSGPTLVNFTEVVSLKYSSQNRYAAIWKPTTLSEIPSRQTGSVIVTFSGSITAGIVVGVINFAGVDQTAPIVTSNSVSGGTSTSSTSDPSLVLSNLAGDELVFDTLFAGGTSGSISDPAVGAGQT